MKALVVMTALVCCVAAQYQHSFHVDSIGGPSYDVSNTKTGFQIQSTGASSQFAASSATSGSSSFSSADAASKSAGISQYAPVAFTPASEAVYPVSAGAVPVAYSNFQSFQAPQKSSSSYSSGSASRFGVSSGAAVHEQASADSVPLVPAPVVVPYQAPVVVPHPAPVAYAVPSFAAQSDAYQSSAINSAQSATFGSSHSAQAASRSGYNTFNTKPAFSTQYVSGSSAPAVSQSSQTFKSAVTKSGSNAQHGAAFSGVNAFGAQHVRPVNFAAQKSSVQSDSAGFSSQSGASSSSGVNAAYGAHYIQPTPYVAAHQPFVQNDAAAYNTHSGSAYVANANAFRYGSQPAQVAVQKSAINYGVVPAQVHVSRAGAVFGGAGSFNQGAQAKAFGSQLNAQQFNSQAVTGQSSSSAAFGAQQVAAHDAATASQTSHIVGGFNAQQVTGQSSSSAAFGAKQVAAQDAAIASQNSHIVGGFNAQQVTAQNDAAVSQGSQAGGAYFASSAHPSFRAQSGFAGAVSNFGGQVVKSGAYDSGFGAKTAYGVKNVAGSSGFSGKKVAAFSPSVFGARIHQGENKQSASGIISTDSAHIVEAQTNAVQKDASSFGYGAHLGSVAYGSGAYGSRGQTAGALYAGQFASGASRQAYPIAANAAFNAAAAQSYIVRQNQDQSDNGFAYSYDTENGISVQSDGQVRNAGTDAASLAVTGSYSYTGDDGKIYTIQYVADERGFVPVGEHISQLSSEIARSIEYNMAHPEEWNVQK